MTERQKSTLKVLGCIASIILVLLCFSSMNLYVGSIADKVNATATAEALSKPTPRPTATPALDKWSGEFMLTQGNPSRIVNLDFPLSVKVSASKGAVGTVENMDTHEWSLLGNSDTIKLPKGRYMFVAESSSSNFNFIATLTEN